MGATLMTLPRTLSRPAHETPMSFGEPSAPSWVSSPCQVLHALYGSQNELTGQLVTWIALAWEGGLTPGLLGSAARCHSYVHCSSRALGLSFSIGVSMYAAVHHLEEGSALSCACHREEFPVFAFMHCLRRLGVHCWQISANG